MVVAIRFLSTDGRQPTVQDIKHAIIQLDMMRAMMSGEEIDVACSVTSRASEVEPDVAMGQRHSPFPMIQNDPKPDVARPGIMQRLTGGGRRRTTKTEANQVENAESGETSLVQ